MNGERSSPDTESKSKLSAGTCVNSALVRAATGRGAGPGAGDGEVEVLWAHTKPHTRADSSATAAIEDARLTFH